MRRIAQQQGVALITALFIFSLVAIAAVAMADRQTLDIRRTENMLHYDQAYMYALGGEQWAAQVLIYIDEDKEIDTLDPERDPWNTQLPPIPVEGGAISGYIRDASARFPINNLVDANGNKQDLYVQAFERFTSYVLGSGACGDQSSFNPDLAHVVLDWIDKNEQVEVGGAEDNEYLNRERQPYRAANQPMASISELRPLQNLIAEEYNCFVGNGQNPPLVNAIRENDIAINVNTAPAEVLQSIHSKIDDKILQTVLEGRTEEPYKKVDDFVGDLLTEMAFGDSPEEKKEKAQVQKEIESIKLSTNSQYFEVTSIAQIGRLQVTTISLLKREGNKVTTLQRSIGVF